MIKFIIGFLLKNFPRSFLQRISKPFFKVITLLYKGDAVFCPICKISLRKFFPYGRKVRENALCPNCLSLERHRLIYLYLKNETDFFNKKLNVLHIAPEQCFIEKFKNSKNLNYITGDLNSPLADITMDIHNMPFKNNTFDVVLCNHVLEHVKDDILALKEIRRVLKKGGYSILQVPFYHPLQNKTLEDKSIIDPLEREKKYGQSDHVRKYGKDYNKRLTSIGFKVDENNYINKLSEDLKIKYGLSKNEIIFIASK